MLRRQAAHPDDGRMMRLQVRAWLARLVTRRERPEDVARALERTAEDLKVAVPFAAA